MITKAVEFNEPLSAVFTETELDEGQIGPLQVMVKTECSLISPGTELAIYRGTEAWAQLPYIPGYAAVGTVVRKGAEIDCADEGDVVFCYNPHRQFSITRPLSAVPMIKIPDGQDPRHIVFTRMAAVSITALRVAPPELGDWVAVQGLGLVGNLAAQLFQLSGARVIGIDISPKRIETAGKCNIEHVINPNECDVTEAVKALTNGKGVSTLVEATGVPSLVEPACSLVRKRGEVVLLGSPRGVCTSDITSLLNEIHLWNNGCITFKGAHEWRYPTERTSCCKHTIPRNCDLIMDIIAHGKLIIEPLITNTVSPVQCQDMYQGLLNSPDEYMGVLFDWTEIT